MGLIVLALMFGVIYLLVIMPNQRRMKAHRQLLTELQVGDEVVTASGIHGAVAEIEDDVVWLEVAPEVELKLSKSAVAERLSADEYDEPDDEQDQDDDELEAADSNDDEG